MHPEVADTLAFRVLKRTAELGLSQAALAKKARLSRQTLSNLLAGNAAGTDSLPQIDTLMSLAHALRVHPFWLIDGLIGEQPVSAHLRSLHRGDRGAFVEDTTCADQVLVAPGEHFFKSWTVQYFGQKEFFRWRFICWDTFIDAQEANGTSSTPVRWLLPDVKEISLQQVEFSDSFTAATGVVATIRVGFTAPREPGLAVSCWMFCDEHGTPTYSEHAGLWFVAVVEPDAAIRAMFPSAVSSQTEINATSGAWRA